MLTVGYLKQILNALPEDMEICGIGYGEYVELPNEFPFKPVKITKVRMKDGTEVTLDPDVIDYVKKDSNIQFEEMKTKTILIPRFGEPDESRSQLSQTCSNI